MEIFSSYGQIKMVDFALDKLHPNQGRGFAYVEFETADEAENAMKHMDGGKTPININIILSIPFGVRNALGISFYLCYLSNKEE